MNRILFALFNIILILSFIHSVDTNAPTTLMSYTSDWETKTVTLNLSCTDDNSGCQMIHYRYDTNPSNGTAFSSWLYGAPKVQYNSPISSNLSYYRGLPTLRNWIDFNTTATVNGVTVIPNLAMDYNAFRADNNSSSSYPTVNSGNFTFDGSNDYISGLYPIYGYDSKFDINSYYWPFDGGTDLNTRDRWQYLKLNATGAATFPAGKVGTALNVTTASSNLSVTAPSLIKVPEKSISFWIRPDQSGSGINTVFSLDSNNYNFGFDSSRSWFFTFTDSMSTVQTATSAISQVDFLMWQHIVFTMDVNDLNTSQVNVKIYKNGTLLSSTDFNSGVSSTYGSTLYIGSMTNSTTNKFSGKIDELKFYPIVIDSNQVDLVYRRNNYYYAEKYHFDFEDCSAGVARNSFGTLDLNISSASTNNPTCTTTKSKRGNSSLYISNYDSYALFVPTTFDVNSGGTVAFWVNPEVLETSKWIFMHNYNNNRIYISTSPSSASSINLSTGVTTAITSTCSGILTQDVWTHIAVTWDDYNSTHNRIKMYANGSLCITQYSSRYNAFAITQTNFRLGMNAFSNQGLISHIDDVRVYNATLDSNTIYDLYSNDISVIYDLNGQDYLEHSTTTYDKIQRAGKLNGTISYLGVFNEDLNQASYDINLGSDGNYAIEYYSEDKSSNTESTNLGFMYMSSPILYYYVYDQNMIPRNNFSRNSVVKVLLTKDNNYFAPIVDLIDSSGNTFTSNVSSYYDTNKYLVQFDLNSDLNEGYVDLNIHGDVVKRAFYISNIWNSKHVSADSETFYYAKDFNIINNLDIDRFDEYYDFDFNFSFNANPNSVRVLEYLSDGNYLETPYSIYDINENFGVLQSAKIGILSSIGANQTKRYFVAYSINDLEKTYATDLDDSLMPDTVENDFYKTYFDLNRGHISILTQKLQNDYNISSPIVSTPANIYDYDSPSTPVSSPYNTLSTGLMRTPIVYSSVLNNNIVANSYQSYSLVNDINTNLIKRYILSTYGKNYDYTYTYTFYSKSKYFTVDFNYVNKYSDLFTSFYDSTLILSENYFSTMFYKIHNSDVSSYNYGYFVDGNDVTGVYPAEYSGYIGPSYNTGFGIIYGDYSFRTNDVDKDILRLLELYSTSTGVSTAQKLYGNLSVDTNTIYRSTNYYSVFNGFEGTIDFNNIYTQIMNPLEVSYSDDIDVYDSVNPNIQDINYSPEPAYDNSPISCTVNVDDDLMIYFVNFIVEGPSSYDVNIYVNDDSAEVSYDFNAGAGDYNCYATAYDYALNSSSELSVPFTVNDTLSPQVDYTLLSPDINEEIDPNTNVDFNIYISEFSGSSIDANFIFRYSEDAVTWSDWNSSSMICNSVSDYNYLCNYSLQTLNDELYYEYKIYSIDELSFDGESNSNYFYSFYERTWDYNINLIADCDINNICSGLIDSNLELLELEISNTGDLDLNFNISSNWSPKNEIYYNNISEGSFGYDFNINSDTNATLQLKVLAKSTVREDSLGITVESTTSNSTPESLELSYTIVSINDGPYIYLSALHSDSSVTNGDLNVIYGIRVANIGTMDCDDAYIEWTLPTGFSLVYGSISDDTHIGTGSYIDYNIGVNILSGVTAGLNNIEVQSGCLSYPDINKSIQIGVAVSIITNIINGGSGGSSSSSGSGSSRAQDNSSSADLLTKAQKFFETQELISIVRGEQTSFGISVQNPFSDVNIANVRIVIDGIFSKYITLSDYNIDRLGPNQVYKIDANIIAPAYLNSGVNNITFNIYGDVEGYKKDRNLLYTSFSEQRLVQLKVYDVSVEQIESLYSKAKLAIDDLNSLGFYVGGLQKQLTIAQVSMQNEDFKSALGILNQIILTKEDVILISNKISDINSKINTSKSMGVYPKQTEIMMLLAMSKLERGDYASAKEIISEADLTYALEVKGEYSIMNFISRNWFYLSVATLIAFAIIFALVLYVRMLVLRSKLKGLNHEESVIINLIKDLQKKVFVDNKMSVDEYRVALGEYESRIDQIISQTISIKNRLRYIFNHEKALRYEKEELHDRIKNLQKDYFGNTKNVSSLYDVKLKRMIKRIGEIETELADIELKNALGKSKWGGFK